VVKPRLGARPRRMNGRREKKMKTDKEADDEEEQG
jgi:hypothetical protein